MRISTAALLVMVNAAILTGPVSANDWEKFYKPVPGQMQLLASDTEPETIASAGNIERDIEGMWQKGYAALGFSYFNTGNSKTKDATKFARKLKARYLIVSTSLQSSRTTSVPITTPTSTTSQSNGTVNAYGSGGYSSGSYSGTTTTYGSQTTYIPITVNRFDKAAIYFAEMPKVGTGILPRELTGPEVASLETRRAFAVRFVRDGSPAYNADIFPGDIITKVNDQPADPETWKAAVRGPQPMNVHLIRNGKAKDISVDVPREWQGN